MKSASVFKWLAVLWLGLGLAPGAAIAQRGEDSDTRTILTVKADGSATLTSETTQQRKTLEQQVRYWDQYRNRQDGEEETEPPAAPKPEQKNLTDEEFKKKIREMYEKQFEAMEQEGAQKIESLEVSSNSVKMVMGRKFESLKELLSHNLWSWAPSVLMSENARFETDTNGQFRVTFTPSKGGERYAKAMAKAWKTGKTKIDWKLVLPGKVVSSTLPETKDNATWLTIDSTKPETIDGLAKLYGAPTVIVAEAGGLKLETPLESKNLMRTARRGSREPAGLPITDAGPGFVAEPVGVAITTVHQFPEGEKYLKDQPNYYGGQTTGTVVTAKLFPPKGRTIRSVSGLRVLKAKDDKGRAIGGTGSEGAEDEAISSEMTFNFEGSERASVPRLSLRMGLPAGDAQTIEELEAEGIVLSIGGWKDMTIPNVQADAQKEIDLGEPIPGAKLIITKVTAKKPQTTVQAKLVGPATVEQLEVKIKTGREGSSSNNSNGRSTTSGGQTTRSITASVYEFNREGGSATAAPTLIVRLPQDAKRERVKFKLTALDLL